VESYSERQVRENLAAFEMNIRRMFEAAYNDPDKLKHFYDHCQSMALSLEHRFKKARIKIVIDYRNKVLERLEVLENQKLEDVCNFGLF
jgi:hypothetical protein